MGRCRTLLAMAMIALRWATRSVWSTTRRRMLMAFAEGGFVLGRAVAFDEEDGAVDVFHRDDAFAQHFFSSAWRG